MARRRGYGTSKIFPIERKMSELEQQHRQKWHNNNRNRIAAIERYLADRGAAPATLGKGHEQ